MAEEKQTSLNHLRFISTIPASRGKVTRNGKSINSPDISCTDFHCWKNTGYVPSCTSAGISQAA